MKKVLVLTYEEDPHANSVCSYLNNVGIESFMVNTDKLIGRYNIKISPQNREYIISDSTNEIRLDSSWNIWNRRVLDPELPANFPKELEDIIFTETERTWEGILFTHKGKVVNRPQANYAANNKISQLEFAYNYGKEIFIPDTLLTNSPQELIKFYKKHHKICHKLQKAALVKREDEYLTTYNNMITEKNMEHAHLIERNPTLFQQYIDKKYEIRITVLENKVIGVAIHSQDSDLSKLDYRRYDFENVKYEKIDLPKNVNKFCLDLIKNYGLSFGEIDMIFTKDNRYVFLELNPNGQWLWLELKSGYNLSKDVAENLL